MHIVIVFTLVRKYFYNKSFQKKSTEAIKLYRILTVTCYTIYVNYKILKETGL